MRRIGIIGMSPGNGHPYSWSAIFNGYDKEKMADCPFPVIPQYLAKVDPSSMKIEGNRITHIWTQDRKVSKHVAGASLIEHVVDDLTDLIGAVDAVILARDDGENHLKMAKPFIDAGVPILIDKPLTDNVEDLRQFVRCYESGARLMSCSSMRYVNDVRTARTELGRVLTAHAICGKYWRTYGIHLLESVFAVMGPGVESVQNLGRKEEDVVYIRYADGRHAVLQTFKPVNAFHMGFYGDKASRLVTETDAYSSFRAMLVDFVSMLDTGKYPIDWHETVEMAKVIAAGTISLNEGNRKVLLKKLS